MQCQSSMRYDNTISPKVHGKTTVHANVHENVSFYVVLCHSKTTFANMLTTQFVVCQYKSFAVVLPLSPPRHLKIKRLRQTYTETYTETSQSYRLGRFFIPVYKCTAFRVPDAYTGTNF